MEEQLHGLIEELGQWNPLWAYGLLMISAVLENLIPPVPGDTVVVFSAYLVGRGVLEIGPVYLATCLGGTLGFMAMYYLGFSQGRAFFAGRRGRFFSSESAARAEEWLARYGVLLVLANRFLSGIRSVIAISAGIGGMSWKKVAVCGGVSMAVWNGLLLYAGLLVGQNWERVGGFLAQYNRMLVFILGIAGLIVLIRWRRRRNTKGDLTI
jgi:membrane protein DedA with SNARE-associated domain